MNPNPNSPSQFDSNAIFWIEVDKIKPNPYQPRRDFDEGKLKDLSESIRFYTAPSGCWMIRALTLQLHSAARNLA